MPGFYTNQIEIPYETSQQRHEVFVEFLGRSLVWLRDWAVTSPRQLAKSSDARERLGTIRKRIYDDLAKLSVEDQETACRIADSAVDQFAGLVLELLSDRGTDCRLGKNHVIRFKLDVEICNVETGEVVEREMVSSGGKRYFGDYWRSWINKYSSQKNGGKKHSEQPDVD